MAASRQESRHTVTQEQGERIEGEAANHPGWGGLKTHAHRQVLVCDDALVKSDTAENLTTTRPPQTCFCALCVCLLIALLFV